MKQVVQGDWAKKPGRTPSLEEASPAATKAALPHLPYEKVHLAL